MKVIIQRGGGGTPSDGRHVRHRSVCVCYHQKPRFMTQARSRAGYQTRKGALTDLDFTCYERQDGAAAGPTV